MLTQNNLPKIQMKGISTPTMDSLLGNRLNFLNDKSELSESNDFIMPNSESEISPGKADAPDFSSAQSNSSNPAVNKTEKCSKNESYSEFSSK